jgi:hypothetical protein
MDIGGEVIRLFAILPLFAASSLLFGDTITDESVTGDLSNNWAAPTSLSFTTGSNQVLGSLVRVSPTSPQDMDYFTFAVPAGNQVLAIDVLTGTSAGGAGAVSFFGIASGTSVINPSTTPNSALAAGLLGYTLYGPADVSSNILNRLATSNTLSPAAQGFSVLGPGNYSVWIQEGTPGTFNYRFDIAIGAAPEPATWFLSCAGLAAIALLAQRKQKHATRLR